MSESQLSKPDLGPIRIACPSRWCRWPTVLLVVLVLLLGLLLFVGYGEYVSRYAWEAAPGEASADDPRWRLPEIDADRKPIPAAENSALHIIAVHSRGAGVQVSSAPRYYTFIRKLPPTTQLNRQQIQVITGELAKIAKPLEEARLLKNMPHGRFPVKLDDVFTATVLPDHRKARELAEWLQHDAWILAQEEQYDRALESCQATLNAGRVSADDPFLLAHLMRLALQDLCLQTLERVLAQGEPSEPALERMQFMLEKETRESSWLPALRGERGGVADLFEKIRDGKVRMSLVRSVILGKGSPSGDSMAASVHEWLDDNFPAMTFKYYPEYLQHMNRCVAIARLPIHERLVKMQAWEEDREKSENPVLRLLSPPMTKIHAGEIAMHATLRCAAAAISCERYRRQYHDWPASLDVLVEKKLLAAVPADPLDNQPLRYRRTKDGIVIYSIGIDLVDNQGNIDRNSPNPAGVDIGFRLWDVPHRRQAPLPPIGIPENELAPQ